MNHCDTQVYALGLMARHGEPLLDHAKNVTVACNTNVILKSYLYNIYLDDSFHMGATQPHC